MTVWTDPDAVCVALGPSAAPDPTDPWLVVACTAANAAAFRKRAAAGYDDPDDDDAPAPSPDVGLGATLWAVALWRERASVDTFASFDDLGRYQPTGATWGTIRRLLGVGLGAVDVPVSNVLSPFGLRQWFGRRPLRRIR